LENCPSWLESPRRVKRLSTFREQVRNVRQGHSEYTLAPRLILIKANPYKI